MISEQVKVVNKLGLHARAATKLVNCASGFEADISVARGARKVNAKSIMGVLTLAAAIGLSLIHISEPTRRATISRMPSSA